MRLLLPGLLLVTLLLAACGGNEPKSTPTTAPTLVPIQDDTIIIRSMGIDAPLALKAFVPGQPLPSPDGAFDVAIYDFSAAPILGGLPGEGGNVILSGRTLATTGCGSAGSPCNGVFLRLEDIEEGAPVEVFWRGQAFRYQVTSVCVVQTTEFSDEVYLKTPEEKLTLLTGGRSIGPSGFEQVVMVTARPAPVVATEPCVVGRPVMRDQ